MSFNRLFEKSPTKSSFKWSVLIMDKGECRRSTRINLGPLLFLIYINDLPNGLQSNPKLFADDTSLFSTVQDITTSTVSLNNDLTKISEWAVQWKMNFNSDPSKQAQELLFSRNQTIPIIEF